MQPVRLYLTRYWMALAPVLLAMLLAAINYDNNLVYAILFLLIGVLVVSALHTYRNLTGLEVHCGRVWPVFAGGTLRYTLQIVNHSTVAMHSITFRRGGQRAEFRALCPYLGPGEVKTVELIDTAEQRGRFYISQIEVASLYPLGLVRALTRVTIQWGYIVYPRPWGNRPWPQIEPDIRTQDDGHYRGGDNFYSLRSYRPGESQRHIDWKAVARGRPLLVKEFGGAGTGRLWFDWVKLSNLDTESKLSQLSAWVVEADRLGEPYGLKLPGQIVQPATGPGHLQQCLSALALYHPHHSGARR